jgi:capsule polysaccharide export protein KpsE/RkpR
MINREGVKKLFKISSLVIIILIIIIYTLFTSHSFIAGPEIIILEPISGSTIATSSIEVTGISHRIKEITLNGKPIIVDKEGNFKEIIVLNDGYNASLLKATDKFGRTTEYKLELVYKK